MELWLESTFYIVLFYTLIPTLIIRLFGMGVRPLRRRDCPRIPVALTFDDGPDPEYTPQVLDLLKAYQVKATFFVLGSKAECNPELLIRMKREGHTIGLHNYVHRSNAVLSPWGVRKQLRETTSAIARITGDRPKYYRPPWGVINIFDLLLLRRMHIVLWSRMIGDWSTKGGVKRLKRRLLRQLRSGELIVLHDSGDTFGADPGAPALMLQALREFLEFATIQQIEFQGMDDYRSRMG